MYILVWSVTFDFYIKVTTVVTVPSDTLGGGAGLAVVSLTTVVEVTGCTPSTGITASEINGHNNIFLVFFSNLKCGKNADIQYFTVKLT